jgi:WhiB family transcriptional regulator, redox-sensing transcriptional regulator
MSRTSRRSVAQLVRQEDWRSLAACRSADPDLFFPISSSGQSIEQAAEAKAICAGCRVQRECLAGAVAGYQLGGPAGAAIGGAAVPYLTAMFQKSADELRSDRTRRAEEMLRAAGEAAGLPPDPLAERASRSPRTRFLTDAAIQAAADTFWPHGVRALGRALAAGLVLAEDAVIDIPKMVMPAMTEMTAPHVQLLDLMVMCRWDSSVTRRGAERIDNPATAHLAHIKSEWTAWEMKAALPSLEPVLGSVIGTLERRGLIERNDSTPGALTKFSEVIQQETNRRNPPGPQGRARPGATATACDQLDAGRADSPTAELDPNRSR